MEKIYGMHKVVGLQLFWSGTPTFSSGTPTFCQMGVLNSCFQNPSESSDIIALFDHFWARSGQIVAILSDLDDPDIIIMIIYILYKHNNNKKKCFKNELNSQFRARSGD